MNLVAEHPHVATHEVIDGAGHFFALTPFGFRAVAAGLPSALDPPGFDRALRRPAGSRGSRPG